jgi:hypothetical protein
MAYRQIYKVLLLLFSVSKLFKVLGVKEQTSMQPMLEPELELDVSGEPDRKRLALMGATAGALGIQAPPGVK